MPGPESLGPSRPCEALAMALAALAQLGPLSANLHITKNVEKKLKLIPILGRHFLQLYNKGMVLQC